MEGRNSMSKDSPQESSPSKSHSAHPAIPQTPNTFAITREQLLPGDIIIVTDTRRKTTAFNTLTRITQTAQHLLFSKGHSEAVHAQIIARDDKGQLKIIEVNDDGVLMKDIEEKYKYNMFVYRPANRILAKKPARWRIPVIKNIGKSKKPASLKNSMKLKKNTARRNRLLRKQPGPRDCISTPAFPLSFHFDSFHT